MYLRMYKSLVDTLSHPFSMSYYYFPGDIALDQEACHALVEAIAAERLTGIKSLEFLFDQANDHIPTFTLMGSVLHHEYLPHLKTLSLGVKTRDMELSRLDCWKALFHAIPSGGLGKVACSFFAIRRCFRLIGI